MFRNRYLQMLGFKLNKRRPKLKNRSFHYTLTCRHKQLCVEANNSTMKPPKETRLYRKQHICNFCAKLAQQLSYRLSINHDAFTSRIRLLLYMYFMSSIHMINRLSRLVQLNFNVNVGPASKIK